VGGVKKSLLNPRTRKFENGQGEEFRLPSSVNGFTSSGGKKKRNSSQKTPPLRISHDRKEEVTRLRHLLRGARRRRIPDRN